MKPVSLVAGLLCGFAVVGGCSFHYAPQIMQADRNSTIQGIQKSDVYPGTNGNGKGSGLKAGPAGAGGTVSDAAAEEVGSTFRFKFLMNMLESVFTSIWGKDPPTAPTEPPPTEPPPVEPPPIHSPDVPVPPPVP